MSEKIKAKFKKGDYVRSPTLSGPDIIEGIIINISSDDHYSYYTFKNGRNESVSFIDNFYEIYDKSHPLTTIFK